MKRLLLSLLLLIGVQQTAVASGVLSSLAASLTKAKPESIMFSIFKQAVGKVSIPLMAYGYFVYGAGILGYYLKYNFNSMTREKERMVHMSFVLLFAATASVLNELKPSKAFKFGFLGLMLSAFGVGIRKAVRDDDGLQVIPYARMANGIPIVGNAVLVGGEPVDPELFANM